MNNSLCEAAAVRQVSSRLRSWKRGLAGSALAASALLLAASPALPNHAWQNYHWARTANPFALELGDNVSDLWDPYLVEARNDWSASSVLDATIVPSNKDPKRCRPTSGRVEVCSYSYGRRGWLGLAQVWVTGGHITQAIAKLNDSYFSMARYNTPAWRRLVMCQEIGHDFGLDHQDEDFDNADLKDSTGKETCMDYTDTPLGNEHPNAHDYEQLELIYGHLDSTTTATAVGSSSADEGGSSPADWGKAVAFTAEGKGRVFLKRLGPDRWLRTHVFWIESRP